MRLHSGLAFSLYILTVAATSVQGAVPITFGQWLSKNLALAEESGPVKSARSKVYRYENEVRLTSVYDGLSVTTTSQRTDSRPVPGKSNSEMAFTYSIQNNAKYIFENSLELGFGVEGRYTEKKNAVVDFFGNEGRVIGKDVIFKPQISYDIIKGVKKSAIAIQISKQRLLAEQQYSGAVIELYAARMAAYQVIAPLYFAACKQNTIGGYRIAVKETILKAEIGFKANLVSQRDYLSILTLDHTLERLELADEQYLSDIESAIARLGETGELILKSKSEIACDLISEIKNLADGSVLYKGKEASVKLIENHPDLIMLKNAMSYGQVSDTETRLKRSASVRPFVGGEYHPEIAGDRPDTGNTVLGITVDWVIPSERYKFENSSSSAARAALTATYASKKSEILSYFPTANREFERLQRAHKILISGYQTAEEYLRATKLAVRFGSSDLINYTTAIHSLIDQKKAVIDSWAAMEAAKFRYAAETIKLQKGL